MEWPFIPFTVRVALSCYDPDNPDPEDQALLAKWCHYWHSPENRSMWASRRLEDAIDRVHAATKAKLLEDVEL